MEQSFVKRSFHCVLNGHLLLENQIASTIKLSQKVSLYMTSTKAKFSLEPTFENGPHLISAFPVRFYGEFGFTEFFLTQCVSHTSGLDKKKELNCEKSAVL